MLNTKRPAFVSGFLGVALLQRMHRVPSSEPSVAWSISQHAQGDSQDAGRSWLELMALTGLTFRLETSFRLLGPLPQSLGSSTPRL